MGGCVFSIRQIANIAETFATMNIIKINVDSISVICSIIIFIFLYLYQILFIISERDRQTERETIKQRKLINNIPHIIKQNKIIQYNNINIKSV